MTSQALAPYTVVAFNAAKLSENKMHDDTVAKRFGFTGGLVPGVDVFAYMSHAPLALWGRSYLERGHMSGRFGKPLYEGQTATVTALERDGGLDVTIESQGIVCGTARATLPAAASLAALGPAAVGPDAASPLALADYVEVAAVAERKPVDAMSYASGKWLGAVPRAWDAVAAREYLADIRETETIYAREGLGHPGLLPRVMNKVLVDNAIMGPWIHVGTRMQLLSAAAIGDELTARAKVTGNYDKKGHRFVELDALVVANGTMPLAHCQHIAITQPREQAAA